MAYEDEYAALREDTGKSEATLDDAAAEAVFVQAAADYGEAGAYAGARVILLRRDWAKATDLADYSQNEESERLSQIADAKKELLDYWQAQLDDALTQVPKDAAAFVFTTAGPRRGCARW